MVSRSTVFLCVFLFACGVLVGAPALDGARKQFDLPAGLAEETLRLFAKQAGGQFVFASDKVAGVRTQSVKGQFTKREALDRMLAGTGLKAVRDEETGAITVDRANGPNGLEPPRKAKTTSRLPKEISDDRNGNLTTHGLAPRAL